MKNLPPHVRLERLLDILSEEIAAATDEEILQACADLKIKPEMKGSMAFIGVKGLVFPYRPEALPSLADVSAAPEPDDSLNLPRRE